MILSTFQRFSQNFICSKVHQICNFDAEIFFRQRIGAKLPWIGVKPATKANIAQKLNFPTKKVKCQSNFWLSGNIIPRKHWGILKLFSCSVQIYEAIVGGSRVEKLLIPDFSRCSGEKSQLTKSARHGQNQKKKELNNFLSKFFSSKTINCFFQIKLCASI